MHIIIGEIHFHSTPIKVAMELYTKMQNADPSIKWMICLEIPSEDKSYIARLLKTQKKLSNELYQLACQGKTPRDLATHAINTTFEGKSFKQEAFIHQFVGRKRTLAYADFITSCDTINVTGIDCIIRDSTSTAGSRMRSDNMLNGLRTLQQQGFSTISIVGQDHLIDFKASLTSNPSLLQTVHMLNINDYDAISDNLPASFIPSIRNEFDKARSQSEEKYIAKSLANTTQIPVYQHETNDFQAIADAVFLSIFPTPMPEAKIEEIQTDVKNASPLEASSITQPENTEIPLQAPAKLAPSASTFKEKPKSDDSFFGSINRENFSKKAFV